MSEGLIPRRRRIRWGPLNFCLLVLVLVGQLIILACIRHTFDQLQYTKLAAEADHIELAVQHGNLSALCEQRGVFTQAELGTEYELFQLINKNHERLDLHHEAINAAFTGIEAAFKSIDKYHPVGAR